MLPKTIDLTDILASERSEIGLMSFYMFDLPNRKITLIRRVFFEELVFIWQRNTKPANNLLKVHTSIPALEMQKQPVYDILFIFCLTHSPVN